MPGSAVASCEVIRDCMVTGTDSEVIADLRGGKSAVLASTELLPAASMAGDWDAVALRWMQLVGAVKDLAVSERGEVPEAPGSCIAYLLYLGTAGQPVADATKAAGVYMRVVLLLD